MKYRYIGPPIFRSICSVHYISYNYIHLQMTHCFCYCKAPDRRNIDQSDKCNVTCSRSSFEEGECGGQDHFSAYEEGKYSISKELFHVSSFGFVKKGLSKTISFLKTINVVYILTLYMQQCFNNENVQQRPTLYTFHSWYGIPVEKYFRF